MAAQLGRTMSWSFSLSLSAPQRGRGGGDISVPRRSSPCKNLVQASDVVDSNEAGRGVGDEAGAGKL